MTHYRLYVNEESTIKVEVWPDGDRLACWVAVRDDPADTWGPPERCDEALHDQTPTVGEAFPPNRPVRAGTDS